MNTLINWKKGFFSSSYQLLASGIPCGFLKVKTFRNNTEGELNNKKYIFENRGFWKSETYIIDALTNAQIAVIKYDSWKNKAVIEYSENKYRFEFDNFWHTKWNILLNEEIVVSFKTTVFYTKGEIFSNSADELLILTGIYISNYYMQRTAAAAS